MCCMYACQVLSPAAASNGSNLSLIQHKLEGGLLALGQFQHALDELLAWMSHTEELLNEQRKAGGDPKAIEIELAKHHVQQTSPSLLFFFPFMHIQTRQ